MLVERIWTGNAYRNYNYLIACPENGEALAIDPLDHKKCQPWAVAAARHFLWSKGSMASASPFSGQAIR